MLKFTSIPCWNQLSLFHDIHLLEIPKLQLSNSRVTWTWRKMGKCLFRPYYCCGCFTSTDLLVWVLHHDNDGRKFTYDILILYGLVGLVWQCNAREILDSERISVEVRSCIWRLSIVWREFMILWINCSDYQLCGCCLTRKFQMLLSRVVKEMEGFATQLFCPWECGERFFWKDLISCIWRHILLSPDCWENSHLQVESSLDVAPSSSIPEHDLTLKHLDSQNTSAQSPPSSAI